MSNTEIGVVTGQDIGINSDGEEPVRILQCTLASAEDPQSVELVRGPGDDSSPVDNSAMVVISMSNSYKLGMVIDDGIEPSAVNEKGERELYSTNNPATQKLATLKLDKNGHHIFNNGTLEAARKTDTTKLTMSPADIAALAAILLSTGVFLPSGIPPVPSVPIVFTGGEITSGTGEIKLP